MISVAPYPPSKYKKTFTLLSESITYTHKLKGGLSWIIYILHWIDAYFYFFGIKRVSSE